MAICEGRHVVGDWYMATGRHMTGIMVEGRGVDGRRLFTFCTESWEGGVTHQETSLTVNTEDAVCTKEGPRGRK